MPVISVTKATE